LGINESLDPRQRAQGMVGQVFVSLFSPKPEEQQELFFNSSNKEKLQVVLYS
jgi:hypothetical protein